MLPDLTIVARLPALRNRRFLCGGMAGGADDVHEAGRRRLFREGQRRCGNGELDQAVGLLEKRRNVARHFDAVRPEAGKLAGIAADRGGARRVNGAGQRQTLGRGNRLDQRAPHAPAGARDDHPHVGHGFGFST